MYYKSYVGSLDFYSPYNTVLSKVNKTEEEKSFLFKGGSPNVFRDNQVRTLSSLYELVLNERGSWSDPETMNISYSKDINFFFTVFFSSNIYL